MKFSKAVKCILGCLVFIAATVLISREIKVLAETSGDWEYEKVGLKEVKLTKYLGSDKKIKVPKKLEGYTVSEIGSYCFSGPLDSNYRYTSNSNLCEIKLPETIKVIGEGAFYGCINLTELRIPSNVETIGVRAIGDSGVTKLVIAAKELKDSSGNAQICLGYKMNIETKLEEVIFEEGVTRIPSWIFAGCKCLKKVVLPDSLTEIGSYAFNGCESIESIELPNNIMTIRNWAFYSCKSLKEISFPASLRYLGFDAFSECVNLENITFYGDVPEYRSAFGEPFNGVIAYVTYPKGNSTWESLTEADKAKFGFKEVEWKAVKVKENKDEDKNDTTKKFKLSSVKNTTKGIKIKWKAVDNAAKYEIYRQTGSGKKKLVKTVTKLTYTDKKASKEGTEYTYTIVALSSSGEIIAESTSKTIVRTK